MDSDSDKAFVKQLNEALVLRCVSDCKDVMHIRQR